MLKFAGLIYFKKFSQSIGLLISISMKVVQLNYLDSVPEKQVMGAEHIHCIFKRLTKQTKQSDKR